MARIIQTENGRLKTQFFIDANNTRIGRSADNIIHLTEDDISANHAQIFTEQDHNGDNIYFLMDLNSTNGSYINKDKVSCKQLKHRDLISFGHSQFTFIDDAMQLPEQPNETIENIFK